MVLRIPLRRSTSLTPDHQPVVEVPTPTPLKMDVNVVVLGGDSVGKSESLYTHTLAAEGKEFLFHIWDFPCSQLRADDGSSEDKRIQWADGFVLVYSICDRASFTSLQPKVQCIKAAREGAGQDKVPIAIVGNKRDLHHRRAVSSEEGRLLALSLDCEFYEVSAAEAYHGALMVFHGLAERVCEAKLALKKGTGIRSIVKSVSAVFARKRTDSM
ncbi:ras-related and estrogen-regulated growth inhibitor-like protein isoform X2 [Sphaerodactylus townsendi]|uniref:ras-related and estrogen-regulated growth inhibitor-like protein isoform X2 n=1 Tax=Sphaerodactylus townsendi TaxID=933632 RepID=UPI002026F8F9|nr:ras-related and estrogen-regulated growth inhibitor-like protein isoform X2 [Sphaerodactylus townsendi]